MVTYPGIGAGSVSGHLKLLPWLLTLVLEQDLWVSVVVTLVTHPGIEAGSISGHL